MTQISVCPKPGQAPGPFFVRAADPPPSAPAAADRPFAMLGRGILERKDLSPTAKVVLAALLLYGRRTGRCFPAEATIAQAAGVSDRTVRRTLPELVRLGLIAVESTRENPTGRSIVLLWTRDPALHPQPRAAAAPGDRPADSLGGQPVRPLRGTSRPTPQGDRLSPDESLEETGNENVETHADVFAIPPGQDPESPPPNTAPAERFDFRAHRRSAVPLPAYTDAALGRMLELLDRGGPAGAQIARNHLGDPAMVDRLMELDARAGRVLGHYGAGPAARPGEAAGKLPECPPAARPPAADETAARMFGGRPLGARASGDDAPAARPLGSRPLEGRPPARSAPSRSDLERTVVASGSITEATRHLARCGREDRSADRRTAGVGRAIDAIAARMLRAFRDDGEPSRKTFVLELWRLYGGETEHRRFVAALDAATAASDSASRPGAIFLSQLRGTCGRDRAPTPGSRYPASA